METWIVFCLVASFLSLAIGVFSCIIGVWAFIELKSFMRSTHKIEYVPLDPTGGQKDDRLYSMDDTMMKDLGIKE